MNDGSTQDGPRRHRERAGAQRRTNGQSPPRKDPHRPQAPPKETKLPSFQPSSNSLPAAAIKWFAKRGISAQTLEHNNIAIRKVWFPQVDGEKTAICFPFMRDGLAVNWKYRSEDSNAAKIFRQEKNAEKVFYGLDNLPDDHEDLIICEGEIDVLSLNEIGYWNVLSVPDGAPAKPLENEPEDDPERDVAFSYLWNCKETLEPSKASHPRCGRGRTRTSPGIRARQTNRPGEVLAGALAGADQ